MDPRPEQTPREIAEGARKRAKAYRERRGISEPTEAGTFESPGTEGPVERKITDLTVERPGFGLAFLVLGPLLPLIFLFDRAVLRDELPHESWTFRYHDWTMRHPELGLLVAMLGAGLTFALAVGGLLAIGILH